MTMVSTRSGSRVDDNEVLVMAFDSNMPDAVFERGEPAVEYLAAVLRNSCQRDEILRNWLRAYDVAAKEGTISSQQRDRVAEIARQLERGCPPEELTGQPVPGLHARIKEALDTAGAALKLNKWTSETLWRLVEEQL